MTSDQAWKTFLDGCPNCRAELELESDAGVIWCTDCDWIEMVRD